MKSLVFHKVHKRSPVLDHIADMRPSSS